MNRKAMALPVVLMVIFVTFSLLMLVSSLNKQNKSTHMVQRENFRAVFIAKGAAQLALLKIRMLPQEFRDASTLYDGVGTIENMVGATDTQFLGLKNKDTLAWINEGDFIRDLRMVMKPTGTGSWDAVNGLSCQGPFNAYFEVAELRLLTRRIGQRNDSVKIVMRAREESGRKVGEVTNSSAQTMLNEGEVVEEIHEILLR